MKVVNKTRKMLFTSDGRESNRILNRLKSFGFTKSAQFTAPEGTMNEPVQCSSNGMLLGYGPQTNYARFLHKPNALNTTALLWAW